MFRCLSYYLNEINFDALDTLRRVLGSKLIHVSFLKASDASCVMTDCFEDFVTGNFESLWFYKP